MKKKNDIVESIKKDFEPLLNFLNAEDFGNNWQECLWNSLADEKAGSGWFINSIGVKEKRSLIFYDFIADAIDQYDKNIKLARSEDLKGILKYQFRRVDIEPYEQNLVAEYIADIPKIFGAVASKEKTLELREKLKEILIEGLQDIEKVQDLESYSAFDLQKKSRNFTRRLTIYPNGSGFPDYDDDLEEDAGNILHFKAYKLLHLVEDSKLENEGIIMPSWGKQKMSRRRDIINTVFEKFLKTVNIVIKLSICACGCGQFFLHFSKKQRKFISDIHRLDFHNRLRNESGKQKEYMRTKAQDYKERRILRAK